MGGFAYRLHSVSKLGFYSYVLRHFAAVSFSQESLGELKRKGNEVESFIFLLDVNHRRVTCHSTFSL